MRDDGEEDATELLRAKAGRKQKKLRARVAEGSWSYVAGWWVVFCCRYAGVESVSLHAVAEVGDLVHTRSNLADTLNSVGSVGIGLVCFSCRTRWGRLPLIVRAVRVGMMM